MYSISKCLILQKHCTSKNIRRFIIKNSVTIQGFNFFNLSGVSSILNFVIVTPVSLAKISCRNQKKRGLTKLYCKYDRNSVTYVYMYYDRRQPLRIIE